MASRRVPLPGQPWDSWLLRSSPLYRRSRELFIKQGGQARATLISHARSLGSATLLENRVDYSPLEAELQWAHSDRVALRSLTTNVFHEQNHRVLWSFLRSRSVYCPTSRAVAPRFLNLAESLIVILDFALGDQLGVRKSRELYAAGVIYSPGSDFLTRRRATRVEYRAYLRAVLHAVYFRLEGLHPEDVPGAVRAGMPEMKSAHLGHAVGRAFKLDDLFVELTNPGWQREHLSAVIQAFRPPRGKSGLRLERRELISARLDPIITDWLKYFAI